METYNNLSLRIYCGAVGTDLDHQLCVEVGAIPKAFSAKRGHKDAQETLKKLGISW